MLEAHDFASRPGPQVRVLPNLMGVIGAALKEPFAISMVYTDSRDPDRERRWELHGALNHAATCVSVHQLSGAPTLSGTAKANERICHP